MATKKTEEKVEPKEVQLADKAVDIKGKMYVLVKDRVVYFNEHFPNGMIITELLSALTDKTIFMRAVITPDADKPNRYFTGFSQATVGDGYINKTSALENCETSAVGRALAMLGIGIIDSIASVDEINKAKTAEATVKEPTVYDRALKAAETAASFERLEELKTKFIDSDKLTDAEKRKLIELLTKKGNDFTKDVQIAE